jgi:hypothetical protein
MSQLVKPKRQATFKGFKRFGAFKGLVEQKKNVLFNSFVCKLSLFGTRAKKGPIYTQTRQINYYFNTTLVSKMDYSLEFELLGK